jgi:hypothetical protein
MAAVDLTPAMQRINKTLAQQARREGGRVTFVCECGRCGGELVPITLEQYDEIRAREDLIVAPGH